MIPSSVPRLRAAILMLCVFLAPRSSLSQERRGPRGPMLGFHYGVPLKWSAALAIPLPGGSEARNAFVAAEPGIGGWRASIGYLQIQGQLGSGYVTRASVLRTGNRAWRAPAGATFVGGEFQYMPLFVLGLRVGAFARVSKAPERKALFTADVSLML